MQQTWFTWANLVTLCRILLIAPFCWSVLQQAWLLAALTFAAAVISDVYDGRLARRFNQVSSLGGLLDHGTDALFVSIGCWSLAQLGLINPWLALLIVLAFGQYTVDSKALAGSALRTSQLGKTNGIAYFVLVGTAVGMQVLDWPWLSVPVKWFAWLLVVTTGLSMLDRAIHYWRHLRGA